jgi:PEP-CTERM motif
MGKLAKQGLIFLAAMVIGGAGALTICQPARATIIDASLNVFTGTGSVPPGPYGAVELNDHGGANVEVTVTLTPGEGFVNTGAGEALTWDLAGNPPVSIEGLNITDFTIANNGKSTGNLDGTGSWFYAIDCKICGAGGSSVFTGTLNFTIDNIALGDFITNGKTTNGYLFASDICTAVTNNTCSSGITGDIAASDPPAETPVPEPSTFVLLGTAGLAFFSLSWLRPPSGRWRAAS